MEAVDKVNESMPIKPAEEWIWVEGYKATEKDMTCRDYQYELGIQHDMPDDVNIKECESGFHLCKVLNDVFDYYSIGDGRRYFKVRALVRKDHYERYGEYTKEYKAHMENPHSSHWWAWDRKTYDNLVARSIIFEQELTPDEILRSNINVTEWSEKYKTLALEHSIHWAEMQMNVDELVELGYSEAFARLIIDAKKYEVAKSVGSQPELSMDMKCWLIFKKRR